MIARVTSRSRRAQDAPALVAARGGRVACRVRLTGLAIWRGITGIYHSNDLTFASSIAYYSLLSLFPFFLLVFSIIASVTSSETDRDGGPRLRPALLPAAVRRSSPCSSTR